MSEKVVIKAEKRENSGKGYSRRLRVDGKVPVTVYGGGGEAVSAAANLSDLAAVLRSDSGSRTVFSLDIDGIGVSNVIFQDRQIDPLKGRLMHADLLRISKAEEKAYNEQTAQDAADAAQAAEDAADAAEAAEAVAVARDEAEAEKSE